MRWQGRVLALGLALLALSGLAAGYQMTATPITLVVDGEARSIRTHQPTVGLLLTDLGMSLRPEDRLTPGWNAMLKRGMAVQIERARPIILAADGRERLFYSQESDPGRFLANAGVVLNSHDGFEVQAPRVGDPAETRFRVAVERAVMVTLEEGSVRTRFYTRADTVGEALLAAGIRLYRADRLSPGPATPLRNGMHIRLERSIPVSIWVDDHVLRTRTHRYRVGEVLADLGVTLNGQDYSDPPLDAPLGEGGEVRVRRVFERVYVEQSPVPFDTVWEADPNTEIDTQALLNEGQPGVLERRIRQRYEDGEVVERRVEGESLVQPPQNRVMGYGIKIVPRTVQTESGPVEYWRVIRMLATSYSAGTAGTPRSSPHYGRTALGLPMGHGIVAVDSSLISLGSKVFVPGYGVGLAGDTGGAIRGRRIDLGYDDENLQLWYAWVEVYLLMPAPSPDRINYILP